MTKSIIITGGCGFIGHHFVEHVLKHTDWNITVIDKLNYASFGFIQLYQIVKNWNVKDYSNLLNFEKIEKLYLILSFAAKLGLAGGVSYGLILRTRNCED